MASVTGYHRFFSFVLLFLALSPRSLVHCGKPISKSFDIGAYTTELINDLLPKDYNKSLRPHYGEKPLQVNVSLLITDISGISETTMDYKIDIYIRHYWHDPRLTFPIRHHLHQVTLGEEFVKKIWLPDTYIENAKELNPQKTVTSEETTMFRIRWDGELTYSTRVAATVRCPMDLTFFPVDQQRCSLEISSYGLLDSELVYSWSTSADPAVSFHPEIYLPSFRLLGYSQHRLSQRYSTGNYSRLQADFYLARSIGYYVSQIYVPTFLIVVISWVPFWLDRDDHHARVALGVTTVLTMTTLVTNTNSDFPRISHLKAIDVYLFAAFLSVFLALIEYAVVGYYDLKLRRRRGKERKTKRERRLEERLQTVAEVKSFYAADDHSSVIDYWARRVFPATFALFNLIYCVGLSLLVAANGRHAQIQVRLPCAT